MDFNILGIVINGVATLIATFIGGIIGAIVSAVIINRRKGKQVREAELGARAIHDLTLDRWGFEVKVAKTKVIVQNPEGLTYIKAERQGIKAKTVQLLHIPGKHSTDHPQGTVVQEPKLTKSPNNSRDIDLHIRDEGKPRQLCEFTIDIMGGGLSKGEGEITYGYDLAFSKMFCMTKEELEELSKGRTFKPEYFCHEVTFPTEIIEAEVEFPEGYPIETHFAVFAGATEFINAVETNDKKTCFIRTHRGGYFKIDNPLVGFRYAIYWMPPPKEDFEKFKIGFDKAIQ